MATLTHTETVKNLIVDTVTAEIDAGGSGNPGTLNMYTSNGGTLLATLTFRDPASGGAFASASGGSASAAAITADTNTGAGTVTHFEVHDSSGTTIFEGDVTSDDVGTGSIQLSSTTLGTGDTLSVSSLSYTAPN